MEVAESSTIGGVSELAGTSGISRLHTGVITHMDYEPPSVLDSEVEIIVAWYDFWVGVFYDKKKRWLYIFPVPCIGIVIKFL